MREPLTGELVARIDDLEDQLDSLRKAVLVFVICGIVIWLDSRKAAKSVD